MILCQENRPNVNVTDELDWYYSLISPQMTLGSNLNEMKFSENLIKVKMVVYV